MRPHLTRYDFFPARSVPNVTEIFQALVERMPARDRGLHQARQEAVGEQGVQLGVAAELEQLQH